VELESSPCPPAEPPLGACPSAGEDVPITLIKSPIAIMAACICGRSLIVLESAMFRWRLSA
jgi:hypothetical protein